MKTFTGDVIIIGAGPAGLTSALEILRHTNLRPVIFEQCAYVGGLAKSFPIDGGFVDIGGHRFHTRSERIMNFWLSIMPLGPKGFKLKKRKSKLFFNDHYFDYPIRPGFKNLFMLGGWACLKIFFSYLKKSSKTPHSLEDFFNTTYGEELTNLFFKSYTEKIWGRPSSDIAPIWGGERLKRPAFFMKREDKFLYPDQGPGHFWDLVANEIRVLGGEIQLNRKISEISVVDDKIAGVFSHGQFFKGDYCISTLPLSVLCHYLGNKENFRLPFRSLISVNFTFPRNQINGPDGGPPQWIYIHQAGIKMARLQFYRSWDESMVTDSTQEIVGLEYFTQEDQALWNMTDLQLTELALEELDKLGIFSGVPRPASFIHRHRDAYPCYWDDFKHLSKMQYIIDQKSNLFSIGRQGLHRYINMDQAMMSGLRAVDFIRSGGHKSKMWDDFSNLHLPE